MVVGPPRLPATLLIALSLLWFTTTTIFKQASPVITANFQVQQQDHHQHVVYQSLRHALHDIKALPSPVKFDFSVFVSRRHHHRKIGRGGFVTWSKFDTRYDVEMHLVPTGPNPLHH
ncbi:hypothetical protein QVD17_39038 [Tagetes erecta]|uniref:Uncharacterized protein n=1 Tax=Tagetes erecta TaxID=13708 RepID=A0AAD8JMV5_TARER|nr:hypothetical protein QVD17_39038 [Tagetes erecta]